MAVINPCCCSLRLGTQIFAIFNILYSAVALTYYVRRLAIYTDAVILVANKDEAKGCYNEKQLLMTLGIVGLFTTIIIIIALLISIAIGILLLNGAEKRDASKCRLWFNITTFFVVVYILYLLAIIILTVCACEPADMIEVFGLVIGILFDLYQLWIVYAFIDEIKRGGGRQNAAHSSLVYTQAPKSEFPTTPAPPPPYSAALGQVYNPTTTSQYEPATVKHPLPTENA